MKRLLSVLCVLALALGLLPVGALAAGSTGYVHNFTEHGKDAVFYTITGNLSSSKGTVDYGGQTLTQCLKMESATNIAFTAPAAGGTLTLVFVEPAGTAKVDSTKVTASNGVATAAVTGGAHTITKADSANLFYVEFAPAEVPEHEHTYGDYEVTEPATCTKEGLETAKCTYTGCSETDTRPIPVIPHTYPEGSTVCSVCDYDKSTQSQHEHKWPDAWTLVRKADCRQAGEEKQACGTCGRVRTQPIPQLKHDFSGAGGTCVNGCGLTAQELIGDTSLAEGGLETAFVEWKIAAGVSKYEVFYQMQSPTKGQWIKLDDQLIRRYPDDLMRADALGLAAGTYLMKAVPDGNEALALTSSPITVTAHDRSGYAFYDGHVPGAYKADGTLKDNALVVYVTDETKDTVTATIRVDKTDTECVGVQNIIAGLKKGSDPRPVAIRFIGNIQDPANMPSGDLYVDGTQGHSFNLTLEGVGKDAVLNGFGIVVKNMDDVEIRNLGFMNCNSKEGDNVGIQQGVNYVWVHNCDMFYGDAGSDADQIKGDGALDFKNSYYCTMSYNHFWDSGKCCLGGMKDHQDQMTYHHNWFDHSDSRHPRMRLAVNTHVYNNYYDGNAKYGIGASLRSNVFAESNYFRNCKYPMLTAMQGNDIASEPTGDGTFGGEDGGVIKAYNNYMEGQKAFTPYSASDSVEYDAYVVENREDTVPASVTAKQGGQTYCNFDVSADFKTKYPCKVETPQEAVNTVTKWAGRTQGGDLKWTFDNSVDDESYLVNAGLKAAVVGYKSKLVSVGGTVGGGVSGGPIPVDGVIMSQTSATLAPKATLQLTATVSPSTADNKTVTWTTSNDKAATVDQNGLVTAVANGSATITATTADGGYTATCAVTVSDGTGGGDIGGGDSGDATRYTFVATVKGDLTGLGTVEGAPDDKVYYAASDKLDQDGFFSVAGNAALAMWRRASSKDNHSKYLELSSKAQNSIQFTVPKGQTAKITVEACSNGSNNTSAVMLTKDGAGVTNSAGKIYTLAVGTANHATPTYTQQGPGVYTVCAPNAELTPQDFGKTAWDKSADDQANRTDPNARGVRIVSVKVELTPSAGQEPVEVAHGKLGDAQELEWTYTDDGAFTVTGPVTAGERVLVACYDDQGRFTGAQVLTSDQLEVQLGENLPKAKLFWLDRAQAPKCHSVTAWGGAE